MAVGRLAKNGQQSLPLLMRSSEEMVATQKTIHPSEADALEYMRKRFLLPT
jgi:hypothetical protein